LEKGFRVVGRRVLEGGALEIIVTENRWGSAMESFSEGKWNKVENEKHKK